MSYTGPNFVNDGPPSINAANLNGMVTELERLSPIGDEVLDIRNGADGKVYSNAGNAVRGQVSVLSGNLQSVNNEKITRPSDIEFVGSATANSGLIGTNGATYAGYDNHIIIDVEEGERYVLTGWNYDSPYLFWFVKNSSNVVIASYSGTNGGKNNVEIVIPLGGTKLYVNGAQTKVATIKKRVFDERDFDDLTKEVMDSEQYKIVEWQKAVANSGLIGVGGQTYAGSDNHLEISVSEGEEYLITGRNFGTPYLLWFVKNSSNVVIDQYSGTTGQKIDIPVTIPSGGATLYVNGSQTAKPASLKKKIFMDLRTFALNYSSKMIGNGVAFGDSLVEGVGVLKLNDSVPTDDAISYASKYLGTTIYNGGIGSTTYNNTETGGFTVIADAISSGNWSAVDSKITQVINDNPGGGFGSLIIQYANIKSLDFNKIDFLIIAYGTNDLTDNALMDDLENPFNKNTILGALRYGISTILTKYKHLKIYVFTPCFRYNLGNNNETSDTYVNSVGNSLPEISNKIKECCDNLHIPCDNLYFKANLNNYNKSIYMSDTVHRNEKGYDLLGLQYAKFISAN